jgi:hypothetical protein
MSLGFEKSLTLLIPNRLPTPVMEKLNKHSFSIKPPTLFKTKLNVHV